MTLSSPASFISGVLVGCAVTACGAVAGALLAHNQNEKKDDMTKATLLQAIALIAAAQNVAQAERVENAQLQNRLAQFQEDHDLVNDAEVNDALGAVIRAAQTAPPSADSAHAVSVTEDFLDVDNDGRDDRTGQTRTTQTATGQAVDRQNAAAGASGDSGVQQSGPVGGEGTTTTSNPVGGEGATTSGTTGGAPTGDNPGGNPANSPAPPAGTPSPAGGETQ